MFSLNKFFLIGIGCVVVSACSGPSGKGGMPTSLDEHAQLVCDEGWALIEKTIEESKGQEKDINKAEFAKLSKSKVCDCTVRTAALGEFDYQDRHYNDFIGSDDAWGDYKSVYATFEKYTYDEALPIVRIKYDNYARDLMTAFVLCGDGFDPETILAERRASESQLKSEQQIAQEPVTEVKQNISEQEATSAPEEIVDNSSQPATQQANAEEDSGAFAPSFDCAKASSGQDKLVCGSRKLSRMDVELSTLYSKARTASTDKNALKQAQLNWYKFQRNACSDESCLATAYESRIIELSEEVSE